MGRGIRNNTRKLTICTGNPDHEIKQLKQEFIFLQKALRVLGRKKNLREQILERMKDIQNTQILTYPEVGSAIKPKEENAFRCLKCNKISIFPKLKADGNVCKECRGHLTYIGEVTQGIKGVIKCQEGEILN